MEIIKVSTKGQVVIPKGIREAHHWEAGQELVAIETPEGVLLRPKPKASAAKLDDVMGCLSRYGKGRPVSVEEMQAGAKKAAAANYRRSEEK